MTERIALGQAVASVRIPDVAASTLDAVNRDGRRWHYRHFYRHPGAEPPGEHPLWLVVGNCQAEALRLVLDAVADRPYRTVRIPPVHELTAADLPHLDHLLGTAAALISQPIRDHYRDLPIGTRQLAARLPAAARSLRWPVIRYAGLYPFQVIVRRPADRSITPPAVPYHDLRTVAAARAGRPPGEPWDVDLDPDRIRRVAVASRDALRHRELRDCDVGVSDVFASLGVDACHTVNHPGNGVLIELARRVLAALDVSAEPGRPDGTLLASAYAPLEARVLDALGIAGEARPEWCFEGSTSSPQRVHEVQLDWYARNPDFPELAVARHAQTMSTLGLPIGAATR